MESVSVPAKGLELSFLNAPQFLPVPTQFFSIAELPETQGGFQTTNQPMSVRMLGTILIILVILMLLGALPTWPYSGSWGYYPSSTLGAVLVIVLVLVLLGRL